MPCANCQSPTYERDGALWCLNNYCSRSYFYFFGGVRRGYEENELRRLYAHLVKRVADEYGTFVDAEWESRVLSGEHDVPLPRQ